VKGGCGESKNILFYIYIYFFSFFFKTSYPRYSIATYFEMDAGSTAAAAVADGNGACDGVWGVG